MENLATSAVEAFGSDPERLMRIAKEDVRDAGH